MSIPHSDLGDVCSVVFADGRHCRTPRSPKHRSLCYFHAKKEAEHAAMQKTGKIIGSWVTGDFVSACDLTAALGKVFSQTAQGNIKPKTAAALGYLGQTLLQAIKVAQHEYVESHGAQTWRNVIYYNTPEPPVPPPPKPVQQPAPQPVQASSDLNRAAS